MLHYLVEQLTYIALTLTETLGYWGICMVHL
jgi:hypothetical protein